MRDDLHKGTSLPRLWKKAVGACLRAADQGPRSRNAVSLALEDDLKKGVTKRGLDLIKRECEEPDLPFNERSYPPSGSGANDDLTATERRVRDLAKARLARGDFITDKAVVRSSLTDLANERLHARRNQAESQLVKNNPAEAKEIIAALRRNFRADISDVIDRVLETKHNGSHEKPRARFDPDEDLRS